jgi:hypothetical protein
MLTPMPATPTTELPRLLAYFVYGENPLYHAEVAFSIATARAQRRGAALDIVVLTDQASLRYPVDARCIHVPPDEFAQWIGSGRYSHRVKLCALRRLMEEDARCVALVDTDTYFTGDPAGLFARISGIQSVMHRREGAVCEDSAWQAVFSDTALSQRLTHDGCPPETAMFNSGVIGVSRENAAAVDAALAWFDAHAPLISAFSLEQMSVSVVLQQRGSVVPCDDLLVHYWGFERPFVHSQIVRSLRTADFRTDRLGLPPVRILDRLRSRLVAQALRWDVDCRFAYQAWLAARTARARHDGYADAWVETTLLVLERARQVTGLVPRNVPALARCIGRAADLGALSAKQRERHAALWQ